MSIAGFVRGTLFSAPCLVSVFRVYEICLISSRVTRREQDNLPEAHKLRNPGNAVGTRSEGKQLSA